MLEAFRRALQRLAGAPQLLQRLQQLVLRLGLGAQTALGITGQTLNLKGDVDLRNLDTFVSAGSTVLMEGANSPQVFTVLSGMGTRYKTLEDGRRQILSMLIPGDLFDINGFMAKSMDHSIASLTGDDLKAFHANWLQPDKARIVVVGDTTLARIIHAVEQAQGSRAPTQRFVDRFSKIYTPAVFLFALGVALIPPLFMAGARLVSFAPISIAIDGLGLNVTAFSYHGTMWICAVACRDMLPDPEFYAECLQLSYDELRDAALGTPRRRR